MLIIIFILSMLILLELFVIRNLSIQNKKYETISEEQFKEVELYKGYILSLSKIIEQSDKRLMEIDKKGAYSSDDEIGWFFSQVKHLQKQLNDFIVK